MLNNKKKQDFMLNIDIASQILKNVFEQSDIAKNSIALELLMSYSSYRKERFALQRTLLVIIMILFLFLPLLFIAPSFTITPLSSEEDSFSPSYKMSIHSFLPVSRVIAVLNNRNIPIYEIDSHEYSIVPSENGEMKVSITLVNHQKMTQYVQIKNVDTNSPVLLSNDSDGKNIYLNLSDAESGLNYDKIKAIDAKGNVIQEVYCDKKKGRIGFVYPEDSLNVYIEDNAGNTLQLMLLVDSIEL